MKDRLLYLTIGLLIGIIVMQFSFANDLVTITSAPLASPIIGTGGIIAQLGNHFLDENGLVWWFNPGSSEVWVRRPDLDPQIPLDQIKFWSTEMVITKTNEAWVKDINDNWVNEGPWPGGSTPTSNSTWGSIKTNQR